MAVAQNQWPILSFWLSGVDKQKLVFTCLLVAFAWLFGDKPLFTSTPHAPPPPPPAASPVAATHWWLVSLAWLPGVADLALTLGVLAGSGAMLALCLGGLFEQLFEDFGRRAAAAAAAAATTRFRTQTRDSPPRTTTAGVDDKKKVPCSSDPAVFPPSRDARARRLSLTLRVFRPPPPPVGVLSRCRRPSGHPRAAKARDGARERAREALRRRLAAERAAERRQRRQGGRRGGAAR